MSPAILGIITVVVWLAFAIPTFIVMLRLFNRTRMNGFLWLIAALFVWPLLARGLSVFLPMVAAVAGTSSHLFGTSFLSLYTLTFVIESLIGGALLLTAFITLDRELAARMEPHPLAPPPPAPLV